MFKIITDNGSDLPKSYLEQHQVDCMFLSTILDGEVIAGKDKDLSAVDFYRMLKDGAKPTTSQIGPGDAIAYFKEHQNEADEFLYVGLSSGLSGTIDSVRSGVEDFLNSHPGKKIEVVDSLTGSPGEGLLVCYAVMMRDEGKTLEETAGWLRDHAKNVLLAITVDNLFDLWRGGRVSRTSAMVGSLVSIKPFIIVDHEGKLQVAKKIRGRRKSLQYLVDYMDSHMGSYREANRRLVVINHGNVPDDAALTADMVKTRFGFENIMIGNVGPMIGTHTGPSIVVIAFLGEDREA